MTERNLKFLSIEVEKFYRWLEEQAFIWGPKYNRSIVLFSYGAGISKSWEAENAFYKGDVIGEVTTEVKVTEPRGSVKISKELVEKIRNKEREIQDKYRREVMPLLKEQEILRLQRELEYDKEIYSAEPVFSLEEPRNGF